MKYKRIILLLICAWFVSCSGNVDNQEEDPNNETENPDDQTEEPDDQIEESDDEAKYIDSLAFWELLPRDKLTTIELIVDSVEFNFCLLNENGVPATRFKEGENFYFYFKMTNHSIDSLKVGTDVAGLVCNRGLGRVKTLDHKTIKHPFLTRDCELDNGVFPFYGENNSRELKIPWNRYYNPESDYYTPEVHIPKGMYYTQFTQVFEYVLKDHILLIGPLTFKINFEIE